MGEVVCTVIFSGAQRRDLVLPDNVPVHLLVIALANALGLPKDENNFYELALIRGKDQERISDSRTLQQAYVCNGAILKLSKEKEIPGSRAILIGEKNQRYRLRENTIIGRLTRETHVDIDLTTLDENKVVSRRHAAITRSTLHYLIKDLGSHNGIFVNQVRLNRDESVVLHHGDEICFGSIEKGVRLTFQHL